MDANTPQWVAVSAAIKARRTNLRINVDQIVPVELVEALCELACWAPNHKRTHPWRFAAVSGDARRDLGEQVAAFQVQCGETDEGRLAKSRGKYLRAPTILLLASHSAPDADERRKAEDRDAVSAGVQNLLLAATAAGLASYWGTGPITDAPAVRERCGFAPDDHIVGAIYLGWPMGEVPVPERQPANVTWVT